MRDLLTTVASFAPNYWATLALGALCAYLGVFTVLRRIVFTGAALAQAAAAGVGASFWVLSLPLPAALSGFVGAWGATLGSLGASVGSALALARSERRGRVSADSMVGVVFAVSSALAVLFVWRSSRGLVELKNILAGDVLLSSSGDLVSLWFGVAGVAAIHASFRARFLLVAYDPPFARAQGLNVRALERLFLASLAVAVALALRAAGLLLVFGTLVLPPLIGLRVAPSLARATWVAVGAAWTSALAGFLFATHQNLPIAPTIVACQALLLALAMAIPRAVEIASFVGGAAALVVGASLGAFAAPTIDVGPGDRAAAGAANYDPEHHHAHDDSTPLERAIERHSRTLADPSLADDARVLAASDLGRIDDPAVLVPLVEAMGDLQPAVAERALAAVVAHVAAGESEALDRLVGLAEGSDPELATHAARALVELDHAGGWARLVERLADPQVPLLLRDATHLFLTEANGGDGLGFSAFAGPEENTAPLAAWRAWAEGR